jgi:hypothetical protein
VSAAYIPTLVLVLCGRSYCHDVKLTCLAKNLFFDECTVTIAKHEGRMPLIKKADQHGFVLPDFEILFLGSSGCPVITSHYLFFKGKALFNTLLS